MNSIITNTLRQSTLIRLYFGDDKEVQNLGIKRAYLDFCRTLKLKDDYCSHMQAKIEAEKLIHKELRTVTTKKFSDQDAFDKFHRACCDLLLEAWPILTYGQAQKWINMTLKYWLLFGDERVAGIEQNLKYFHIPIDSYVQKGMFDEKTPKAWSKIDSYDEYMNYQLRHRATKTNNFPIIDELIFFNNYKP